jgi:hypothetical protein
MAKPIPTLAFPETLDNTTISAFAKCPRQFFWGSLLHLKPKATSIHLHAGRAYATLCETFRKCFYDPSLPTYRNIDEALVKAIRAFFDSYGYDPALEGSELWQASAKSANRMLECFFAMLDEYPPLTDPIKPLMIDGKPAIELSFSIPLNINHPDTGEPILFHGRFDMLAEYNGQVFVFDDKTTSSLGPQWNKQWEFRSQFTGYCLGAQSFGVEVAGAIVRGHCILKGGFKFAQPITYRKPFQLQQWWQDIHAIVYQMVESYKRAKSLEGEKGTLNTREHFPSTGTFNEGCNAYSGCSYRELCGASHPQRWLGEYVIQKWNPTDPDSNKPEEIKI